MPITILTDLFDPAKGSEFQVAQKAIKSCVQFTNKKIIIWTLERGGNRAHILNWLQENGFEDRITLKLVPLKYADNLGNHKNKFLFFGDLFRLYKNCIHHTDATKILWKSGQTNFVFNLAILARHRDLIIGPISGLEYPPIKAIFFAKEYFLFVKYSLYSAFIFTSKILIKLLLWRNRNKNIDLFYCTETDKQAIAPHKSTAYKLHDHNVISEVDLTGLPVQSEIQDIDISQNLDKPPKIVLWSGQLITRKNPKSALKVAEILLKNNQDIEFQMIGNGPLLNQLKFPKNTHGRFSYISEMARSEFFEQLKQADILLVTSWREANSVLIYEAMSLNIPVVSLDISGMKQTVATTGVVYDLSQVNDHQHIANCVVDLLSQAPSDISSQYILHQHKTEFDVISEVINNHVKKSN